MHCVYKSSSPTSVTKHHDLKKVGSKLLVRVFGANRVFPSEGAELGDFSHHCTGGVRFVVEGLSLNGEQVAEVSAGEPKRPRR
jgi:hypothetical protein